MRLNKVKVFVQSLPLQTGNRSPNPNNMNTFFDEITACLSKAAVKCENTGYGELDTFYDLFNLTNLIHSETCLIKNRKSTIDLFLTNKPKSFFKTYTSETGPSDYHKLISTFFTSKAARRKPKVIFYRNYKKFDKKSFSHDLQNKNLKTCLPMIQM